MEIRRKQMSKKMIKNAIIESTMLGREDHGIMTWMIFIKFDKCVHCGVGGYALDGYDSHTETRVCVAESMESIVKVLDVVGVDKWEDLPGKYIRFEDNGWGSTITKIGNIIDDKWFDLKDFFGKVGKTYD
jgi:hypothetical protein